MHFSVKKLKIQLKWTYVVYDLDGSALTRRSQFNNRGAICTSFFVLIDHETHAKLILASSHIQSYVKNFVILK